MNLFKRLKRAYHYSLNYFKIEKFFEDKLAKYYIVDGECIKDRRLFGTVDMMRVEKHIVDDYGDHKVKLDSLRTHRNFTITLDPETVTFNKKMNIMRYMKYDKYTGETDIMYVTKDVMQIRKILKNIINELIQSDEKPSTRQSLYCDAYKAALSHTKSIIVSL